MTIPKLICTQHPDSTVKITVQQEVDEAIQGYAMYGCEEVMSDYEGKLTPYAQPKDIVVRALELDLPVGDGFYITPRIPNPSLEEFDRVDLSIEAGIIANYYSFKSTGVQAVKWFILPMVEDVDVVKLVQRLILRKQSVLCEELRIRVEPLQLIPLIEDTYRHISAREYIVTLLRILRELGVETSVLRVFIGKSDAAVKSGHIASSLSVAYALRDLYKLMEDEGIVIKPIIGMGSPPFRGALNNPELVDHVSKAYSGYTTATIQSAVRYDVPYSEYLKVRNSIISNIDQEPRELMGDAIELITQASRMYRELASRYVNTIQKISDAIPSTRERVSWKIYGRFLPALGEIISVPRAIVYTSSWYVAGVPPVFLDADYISHLYKQDKLDDLLKMLPSLIEEWRYESKYYVREVAAKRLNDQVVKKVDEALDILGIDATPLETYESLLKLNSVEPHILALGKIRGYLG